MSAKGVTSFFYCPAIKGRPACVIRTAGGMWNAYLLQMAGIYRSAFFSRDSFDWEPETHSNGHPFGWVYKDPEKSMEHEAHYQTREAMASLQLAFEQERAQADEEARQKSLEFA